LAPEDYVSYCNNESNALIQKREFGTLLYSIKYETVEYKALQELFGVNKTIDKKAFEQLRKEYEGLCYFTFKIESPGSQKSPIKSLARSEEDLAKLNMYCQTGLQQAFYIESNGIKIPCVLFHIEDDHNLANYNIISLAFEKDKIGQTQDFTLVFDDPLFKTGLIKFNISKELIQQLPTLKLS
jgi:hypothetical protein